MGSSPDDDFHLTSIWCANAGSPAPGKLCSIVSGSSSEPGTPGYLSNERLVPDRVANASCYKPVESFVPLPIDCLKNLGDGLKPSRANAGLYPSGFYRVMGLFVTSHVGVSVALMRLFNVALAVLLFFGAWLVNGPSVRRALIASWLVLAVPLGMFLIPSTNPSSWAIAGLGALWAYLFAWLSADTPRLRIAAAVGAVAAFGIALSARADSGAMGLVIAGAATLAALPSLRAIRSPRVVLPVVLAGVGAVMFLATSGAATASKGLGTYTSAADIPAGRHGFRLLAENIFNLPALFAGIVGGGDLGTLGWQDTVIPPQVSPLLVAALAAVVIHVRGFGWRRAAAILLVLAAMIVMPLEVLQLSHVLVGNQVQARYIYPLALAGFGIALAAERGRDWLRLGKAGMIVVGSCVAVANLYALHAEIARYALDNPVGRLNLNTGAHWGAAFITPTGVWLLGVVAGIVAVVILTMSLGGPVGGRESEQASSD